MGFVRVSGYNQTDLDNKYQEGYDDGYPEGYDDGASDVTNNPTIILAADSRDPSNMVVINADSEDFVNVHVVNSTTHDLKIVVNGSMSGVNRSVTKTVNGVTTVIDWIVASIYSFESGADLHFYQEKNGGSSNQEGSIFLTIIGKRSNDNYTNGIVWTSSEDKTEGTATFATLLS